MKLRSHKRCEKEQCKKINKMKPTLKYSGARITSCSSASERQQLGMEERKWAPRVAVCSWSSGDTGWDNNTMTLNTGLNLLLRLDLRTPLSRGSSVSEAAGARGTANSGVCGSGGAGTHTTCSSKLFYWNQNLIKWRSRLELEGNLPFGHFPDVFMYAPGGSWENEQQPSAYIPVCVWVIDCLPLRLFIFYISQSHMAATHSHSHSHSAPPPPPSLAFLRCEIYTGFILGPSGIQLMEILQSAKEL